MFKKILAATDGSDHGTKAVKFASELAGKYGAKLVLVHVLQHGRIPEPVQKMLEAEHLIEPHQPASLRAFEKLGEHFLGTAKQLAQDAGVKDIREIIEHGEPAHQILACADREKADLIVVGSRGLSELKGMLIGSVSYKLIQLAKCTCIAVK
jgi:nucleotide-binding universal stress UspA family protein